MALGFGMPDWCDDKILGDLKRANEILYTIFSYNNESKKIFMGQFLEKIIQNIQDNIDAKSNKKIYLYSAHDVTLFTFLRSNNIDHIKNINYGSAIALEKLRGKDDKQYIRVSY